MKWKKRYCIPGEYHEKGMKPFKPDGTPTRQTAIALCFLKGYHPKTREEILLKTGVSPDRAKAKGQNASLFQTLTQNEVIEYDKNNKHFKTGEKYKAFMEYCARYMRENNLVKGRKAKSLYRSIIIEFSPSLDFILN